VIKLGGLQLKDCFVAQLYLSFPHPRIPPDYKAQCHVTQDHI